MTLPLRHILRDIGGLLFPRRCVVCGNRLTPTEKEICTTCYAGLPLTRYKGKLGNGVERLFWWKIDIVRANSFMRYEAGADSRYVVLSSSGKYCCWVKCSG